jgi:hypothetical protein
LLSTQHVGVSSSQTVYDVESLTKSQVRIEKDGLEVCYKDLLETLCSTVEDMEDGEEDKIVCLYVLASEPHLVDFSEIEPKVRAGAFMLGYMIGKFIGKTNSRIEVETSDASEIEILTIPIEEDDDDS